MAEKLVCFFTLWSLIVAPNLCRAGLLTSCCTPGKSVQEVSVASDGCCGEKHTPVDSPSKSEPRECDSCAQVCDVVVKAPEDAPKLDCCQTLVVFYEVPQTASEAPAVRFLLSDPEKADESNLPFPRSDVPLLI